MSFAPRPPRSKRAISLTPMIDVVFLLLIFFMLAAKFERAGAFPVTVAGRADATAAGPPRLVDVAPAEVRLNGRPLALDALAGALLDIVNDPGDVIAVRARDGADTQRLVDVLAVLSEAGFTGLALVE